MKSVLKKTPKGKRYILIVQFDPAFRQEDTLSNFSKTLTIESVSSLQYS